MGDLLRTGRPKSGSEDTCVRHNGGSVVDITFATPDLARRVQGWRVLVEEETLSDHRYIRFSVSTPRTNQPSNSGSLTSRRWGGQRWAVTRLNREAVKEAALVQAWFPVPAGPVRVEEEAEWFGGNVANLRRGHAPGPMPPSEATGVLVVGGAHPVTRVLHGCAPSTRQTPPPSFPSARR
ncbi:uncharacterized protein LOC119190723 [Manduca sexta]|uniref:uncharacterized protein LOC119190723 n=1 Tax=Manduca sexta TaxID=7130 RepID=UPI00188F579A|nr:uncharacterized protein LOC119190723 [Manduca sexta]